jgi:hypothetical protein
MTDIQSRHGFAWDDGNIDRVVDFTRDPDELAYLEPFLGLTPTSGRQDSKEPDVWDGTPG